MSGTVAQVEMDAQNIRECQYYVRSMQRKLQEATDAAKETAYGIKRSKATTEGKFNGLRIY